MARRFLLAKKLSGSNNNNKYNDGETPCLLFRSLRPRKFDRKKHISTLKSFPIMSHCKLLAWLLLSLVLASRNVEASNIVITSDEVAIVAGVGLAGLISRQLPAGEEKVFPLPFENKIQEFNDVATDPNDPGIVWAFGSSDRIVCSFRVNTDASLRLLGCQFDFPVGRYSGLSVMNGIVIISGGTGGFTVYTYNLETGAIEVEPSTMGILFDSAISYSDVLLVSPRLAALSTEFDNSSGGPRFGTTMVDLAGFIRLYTFPVGNSIGSEYAVRPSNFALESALYTTIDGESVLYTVSGSLSAQDPTLAGSATEILYDPDIDLITLAVNQQKHVLVLGAVDRLGDFSILLYSLADPLNPEKFYEVVGVTRITSVATNGDMVGFTTIAGTDNQRTFYTSFVMPPAPLLDIPTAPPVITISPTRNPTDQPTASPPSTNPPTAAPSSPPSDSPVTPPSDEPTNNSSAMKYSRAPALLLLLQVVVTFFQLIHQ